jgi:hypothetical protein
MENVLNVFLFSLLQKKILSSFVCRIYYYYYKKYYQYLLRVEVSLFVLSLEIEDRDEVEVGNWAIE